MDLNEKIQKLRNSLTYQMSLGSKELYHSNVWAWLINTDSNFVKCFFDNINPEDLVPGGTIREEEHRDVTIHLKNGKVLVIENKLKSIPSIEQLEKYSKDLSNKFSNGLLTGFETPRIVDQNTQMVNGTSYPWKFKPYNEIAAEITKCLNNTESEVIKQNKSVIESYCKDLEYLYFLVNSTLKENNNKLIHFYNNEYEDLGINDLINKINGSCFMKSFEENVLSNSKLVEELGLIEQNGFYLAQGFNNKQITLDFKYTTSNNNLDFTIGIQIQGNQFRRFVVINNGTKDPSIIFNKFKSSYFDENYYGEKKNKERKIHLPGIVEPKRTSLTRKYSQYNGNFVYQYFDLDKTDNSFETILELLINDLRIAKTIFEENKKLLDLN